MGMLTKRSSVLGLPIGPKEVNWASLAKIGGAAVAAVAAQQGRQKVQSISQNLQEPIEQGKEFMEDASEIGEDVSEFTDKFSGGGGGGGGLLGKAASFIPGLGGGGGGDGEGGGDGYTKKLRLVIKLAQDVGVPRSVAYNQWTQYEDFPDFMKGVVSVDPEDEVTQKWTVKIGPSRRQFTGEVEEQVPDERIQWKGSEGAEHSGVVTFHELDDNLTRVQVEMEYFANGFIEKIGNIFLAARRKARKDLRLFKHYMEFENEETGAWRGEISEGEVISSGEEEEEGEEAQESEQEPQQETAGAQGNGGRSQSGGQDGSSEEQASERERESASTE